MKAEQNVTSCSTASDAIATGVLLIAHGSRSSSANEDLVQLAQLIRAKSLYTVVETAYLEIVEPDVREGASRCVAAGVGRVLMFPYFLSAGTHATDDLKHYQADLSREFPAVDFVLCPPLGLHPGVVTAVVDRLEEGRSDCS